MIKYRVILTILILGTFSLGGRAQHTLSGSATDAASQPLPFANVLLLSSPDSSFVTGNTTDEKGEFTFATDREGTFLLKITALGYENYLSEPFVLSAAQLVRRFDNLVLREGGIALSEVRVKGERPLFVRQIDRTVINIANQINTAGSSALEILERSPGVVVNRQRSTIAMLGKNGVNVMLNGKMQYMPADALFAFLAGLNADNIQSIELITTPPANLDAQGNAGYINIVLKSNPDEGLSGSYALSAGYGRGETGNASLSLNYRKKKVNVFGNYSYLRSGQEQYTDLERRTGQGAEMLNTLLTSDLNPITYDLTYRMASESFGQKGQTWHRR